MTRARAAPCLAGLLAGALLALGRDGAAAQPLADRYQYENLPRDAGIPTPEYVLIGDVLADDVTAMRRHAWGLWAALTRPSRSVWDGQRLPVFETWYSIPEVFNAEGRPGTRAVAPRFRPETFVKLEGVSGETAARFDCRGHSFAFVHRVDRASAALAQAVASGKRFPTGEVDAAGARCVLHDVHVSSVTTASRAGRPITEPVTGGPR